jgi:hypothetical protein
MVEALDSCDGDSTASEVGCDGYWVFLRSGVLCALKAALTTTLPYC